MASCGREDPDGYHHICPAAGINILVVVGPWIPLSVESQLPLVVSERYRDDGESCRRVATPEAGTDERLRHVQNEGRDNDGHKEDGDARVDLGKCVVLQDTPALFKKGRDEEEEQEKKNDKTK